jgi:hypothetical protein
VWEKWKHEDEVINHRLTWLGFSQGLLFAAYGLIIQLSANVILDKINNPTLVTAIKELSSIIPMIGILTSSLVLAGVLAAAVSMCIITKKYNLETFGVSTITTISGLLCALGFPSVFIWAWLQVPKCIIK